jgi:hypothetical protein
MTEHHRLHPDEGAERGEKGLKKDAIGFIDGLSCTAWPSPWCSGLASCCSAWS